MKQNAKKKQEKRMCDVFNRTILFFRKGQFVRVKTHTKDSI